MMSLSVWLPGPVFLLGGSPEWVSVQGVSVQGDSLSRGLCPGKSLSGGSLCQGDPPYCEERAVCILLESFLVIRRKPS